MVQFCFKLLYQFSETIIECVWLRIAWMEMDWNLKTLGFQVSPLPVLIMVCFPSRDVLRGFCVQEKVINLTSATQNVKNYP